MTASASYAKDSRNTPPMIQFQTTHSHESSLSSHSSSSSSSFSDHSFRAATFIKADHHHINLVPLSDHIQDFRSRKPSFSGCLNVSPKPWDRLKLWWGCFSLMDDFPVPVSFQDRNKKFPVQKKSEEIHEGEVSVLHKMLDQLQQPQNNSSLTMLSNSLPPKMKELLSELAMVENEITRLESQISQLKSEEKHEKVSHVEHSNSNRTVNNHHESNEKKVAFEIKALHFISKAIKGDYKEKSFSTSRRFSTKKEDTSHDENRAFQEKFLRRNGTVKPPSPLREPRHPTPWRDHRSLDIPTDNLHSEEENMQRWHPNKLSENIMKCLIFIFVRLLRTSRAIELEKSGPIIRSSSKFSLSFRAETGSTSKSGIGFQKDSRQQDPYGIFDCEESIPRDIGPYKNLVRFTSSSMDPKCIKSSSSVPLFQKLKVLMDGLRKVDLRFLSHQQKLAFWINMYNACIMHGFLQYGVPSISIPEKLLALINKATLTIAGNSVNAQAIERFILRKPSDSLDKEIFGKGGKETKQMIVHQLYGLETPDPNIVFALCCGTRSSPAVKIYTAEGVTSELERSKLEYLQAAVMVKSTKKIAIPELLLKNKHDFADDVDSLMEWLCQQLPTSGSLRKSIVDCCRVRRGGGGVGDHKAYSSTVVENIPYEFEFQYLLGLYD